MKAFRKSCRLMGSSFELCIVSNNEAYALQNIEKGISEIQRIEHLLTEFSEDSFTSQINRQSGLFPVDVPNEFFQLVQRSIQISKLTKGYFDLTVGPLKKLFKFDRKEFLMPSKKTIRKTLELVGFKHIELNSTTGTIFCKQKNMRISFAAIGKGYAADMVKKMWLNENITSGFINASGDLTAFGTNENSEPWKIGIANPDQPDQLLFYVPLNNASVATSGDSEQHFLHKGRRYSHNINPKTGMPLQGLKSVSVFSPSAELSDAFATAIYAMEKSKALAFINQLPQTHAILIDDKNNVSFSKNLNYEVVA